MMRVARAGRWVALLCVLASAAAGAAAELRLAPVFGDHMVLQRGKPVPVWGLAPPGTRVAVEFAGQRRETIAEGQGDWRVTLEPLAGSDAPRPLAVRTVPGAAPLTCADVVVGEVWLCSGQSNMRFPLRQARGAAEARTRADCAGLRWLDFTGRDYAKGRLTGAQLRAVSASNYYSTAGWQRSAPGTVADFSAVAYFFGRKLQAELGVPVGLIHNAIGGAPVEAFIPAEAFRADASLRGLLRDWLNNPDYPAWCRGRARAELAAWAAKPEGAPPHHPYEPGFLFEAGVRPLLPGALRGAVWYQGESNATVDGERGPAVDPALNRGKLLALIRGWRAAWGEPALPFYFVQLPGMNRDWAPFRALQAAVARDEPHCGMAVAIDVGDAANVHPADKQPVGERLARQALRKTYGRDVTADGPHCRTCIVRGGELVLGFDAAGGLASRGGGPPQGFELAGPDGRFAPAAARIAGATVIVSSPAVAGPRAVRYAWADAPVCNLVDREGLPAGPFRTSPDGSVMEP